MIDFPSDWFSIRVLTWTLRIVRVAGPGVELPTSRVLPVATNYKATTSQRGTYWTAVMVYSFTGILLYFLII